MTLAKIVVLLLTYALQFVIPSLRALRGRLAEQVQ